MKYVVEVALGGMEICTDIPITVRLLPEQSERL
jgi:hypothetical protein